MKKQILVKISLSIFFINGTIDEDYKKIIFFIIKKTSIIWQK